MTDYLNYINEKFPVRKTLKEKEQFAEFAVNEGKKLGFDAKVENNEKKHNNLVFGDVEKAKVVFTAHYDTPAASLLPNIMMPRNMILGYAYAFFYPFAIAMICLALAYLIIGNFDFGKYQTAVTVLFYLVLYFSAFCLSARCFKNKHNINDNTSGVAAIFSIMAQTQNKDVAFILFDNEEKGLKGSKAYAKANKAFTENKLLLNLDCVGNGKHFLFVAKDGAEKLAEYDLLKQQMTSNGDYQVYFYPKKDCMGNSDYKNFDTGIGVMACSKKKAVGFYTARIHTNRDVVAKKENIDFISSSLIGFVNSLD